MAFSDEFCGMVEEWLAEETYSLPEIAQKLGVGRTTVYEWQKNRPDFADAIKRGRARFRELIQVDAKRGLRARVRGMTVTETRRTVYPGGGVEEVTVTKQLPPDVTACIFALKNLDPEVWDAAARMDRAAQAEARPLQIVVQDAEAAAAVGRIMGGG